MDSAALDEYIDAWVLHAFAGGPDGGDLLARLLGCMSAEVRYEDVPSRRSWDGHDGVAKMSVRLGRVVNHGLASLASDPALREAVPTSYSAGQGIGAGA